MITIRKSALLAAALAGALGGSTAFAQSDTALERIEVRAQNRPLASLARAAEAVSQRPVTPQPPREIVNYRGPGETNPTVDREGPDPALQNVAGNGVADIGEAGGGVGFDGASNYGSNGPVLGYIVTPPDTDGQIGGTNGEFFVQMVNSVTTVFDRAGNALVGPVASNVYWAGMGGLCDPYNQGDPIVVYDENLNRWLISQFAFPDSFNAFSQCVAISQTDDPTGSWNRYEFSFDRIGFPDYPKHGIVTDSITMMANIFRPRGPFFTFSGTFVGVMDKAAMYAGQPASLLGYNLGTSEFGFVAGDRDGGGNVPALFATAMSTNNALDIWRIDVDWATESTSVAQIASVGISPYDSQLCGASRGACIPQPDGGPALESLSDRLMHRLQIRDFGSYRTLLAAHTVDATGNGVAGIRWYELRETGGNWSLYQEGTYAPADGLHRWIPSIAMNDAGDIGLGFLVGGSSRYVSVAVTGQSAAASGSGVFDAAELTCIEGSGVQLNAGRSGDYASTSVDPFDGLTFWHTNEYIANTAQYSWNTFVCPFTVGDGGTPNAPPVADIAAPSCTDRDCSFNGGGSSDSDGTVVAYAWDFGDGSPGASGATTTHTFPADGTFTVTLTVTDDLGATGSTSVDVTVDDGINDPPVAVIDSISCTGLACDYDGSGSSDPDGSVVSYAWDFGDSGSGSGATTSHTYTAGGTYTVTLTVTDNGGATGSTSQDVTVTEPTDPVSLSVAGIVLDTPSAGGGQKQARALVTVRDDQGNPVGTATVTGDFTGGITESGRSGVSGGDGVAAVTTAGTVKGKLKFTFCVTSISHGSLTYDAAGNAVTCASN